MKDTIHRLWVTIVILSVFLVVETYISLSMYNDYEYDFEVKQRHINFMEDELQKAEAKLKEYKATEQWLMELGASSEEAKETIKAAEAHRVSPKF